MMNNNTNFNGTINMNMDQFAELIAAKIQNNNCENGNGNGRKRGKYDGMCIQGEIYSPYTCRRFLPAQFMRLLQIKKERRASMNEVIRCRYDGKYEFTYTKHELEKLVYIKKHDKIAFTERCSFFTRSIIKEILIDICNRYALDEIKAKLASYEFWNYEELLQSANAIEFALNNSSAKRQMRKSDPCNAFIKAFKKAGAYYTLKNFIMFKEDFKMVWYGEIYIGREAIKKLHEIAMYEDYEIMKSLELSMKNNGISCNTNLRYM